MSVVTNESIVAISAPAPVAVSVKDIIAVGNPGRADCADGAMLSLAGMTVQEWAHDARHLLGFPCRHRLAV